MRCFGFRARFAARVNPLERLRLARATLSPFDGGILLLMIAWALAIISLPILKWLVGENALPIGISVGVLLQLTTVWAILVWTWGVQRAWRVTIVVVACAWAFEYVGHTTGVPFGSYVYTERLQPQIGGVPLLIPLAWLTMLPPAWAIADRIAQRFTHKRLAFIGVSALAVVVWDLLLDPQMVGWKLWTWTPLSGSSGGYFGIPWTNFAGWGLAAALITALASLIAPLGDLPARPLIALYAITWVLEVIGLLCFWGLTGPALVGGAAMGGMLIWSVRSP